jgi:DNA-binding PadR family transcriptional regulator
VRYWLSWRQLYQVGDLQGLSSMPWPLVSTRVVVLQALAHGDKTLRELIEYVGRGTGGLIVLNDFQLFRVLRELESEGLVAASGRNLVYTGNSARRGRPGRFYRVRAAGSRLANAQALAISGLLQAAVNAQPRNCD